ncbi:hypothetical protein MHYP_G00248880 [Metynnis hypsauchen]
MSKTFSSRRLEVVSSSPAVQDVKERWPALFSEAQIKEEFRRITTIRLEETFMSKLDGYTPRLLELVRAKGGMAGTKLRPILDAINQSHGIERKRDMVIQSLIEYLGESREELFHDCQSFFIRGGSSNCLLLPRWPCGGLQCQLYVGFLFQSSKLLQFWFSVWFWSQMSVLIQCQLPKLLFLQCWFPVLLLKCWLLGWILHSPTQLAHTTGPAHLSLLLTQLMDFPPQWTFFQLWLCLLTAQAHPQGTSGDVA